MRQPVLKIHHTAARQIPVKPAIANKLRPIGTSLWRLFVPQTECMTRRADPDHGLAAGDVASNQFQLSRGQGPATHADEQEIGRFDRIHPDKAISVSRILQHDRGAIRLQVMVGEVSQRLFGFIFSFRNQHHDVGLGSILGLRYYGHQAECT